MFPDNTLPILKLNDFAELTDARLLMEFTRISKNSEKFEYKRLNPLYWENKILSERRQWMLDHGIADLNYNTSCWGTKPLSPIVESSKLLDVAVESAKLSHPIVELIHHSSTVSLEGISKLPYVRTRFIVLFWGL